MSSKQVVRGGIKDKGAKAALRPAPPAKPPLKKTPIDLDMGEGSREQGFMLNGCR